MSRENPEFQKESHEDEQEIQSAAEALNFGGKIAKILNDPDIKALGPVALRSAINLILSASELSPIAPFANVPSFVTDVIKAAKMAKGGKLIGLEKFDLTPDVSVKRAWLYELMELPTFGFMPTHTFETIRQFRKGDLPKIKAALIALRQIIRDEATRSDVTRAATQQARDAFKK